MGSTAAPEVKFHRGPPESKAARVVQARPTGSHDMMLAGEPFSAPIANVVASRRPWRRSGESPTNAPAKLEGDVQSPPTGSHSQGPWPYETTRPTRSRFSS